MELNIKEIKEIIPHEYPFLLIDKVIGGEEGKWIRAIKNLTYNESFFQGHFPNYPIMPGVLIVEAMAQAGAVCILSQEEHRGKKAFFAGIKNLRFKRPVYPGDVLVLESKIEKVKMNIGWARGIAKVDGEVCCEGQVSFALGE